MRLILIETVRLCVAAFLVGVFFTLGDAVVTTLLEVL